MDRTPALLRPHQPDLRSFGARSAPAPLPDGYKQDHEQPASVLVAAAELPVVDLHARIQPGLHVGRVGQHGLDSAAVT
jgi:hypothetical protein